MRKEGKKTEQCGGACGRAHTIKAQAAPRSMPTLPHHKAAHRPGAVDLLLCQACGQATLKHSKAHSIVGN